MKLLPRAADPREDDLGVAERLLGVGATVVKSRRPRGVRVGVAGGDVVASQPAHRIDHARRRLGARLAGELAETQQVVPPRTASDPVQKGLGATGAPR